jgi:hypothetical protein
MQWQKCYNSKVMKWLTVVPSHQARPTELHDLYKALSDPPKHMFLHWLLHNQLKVLKINLQPFSVGYENDNNITDAFKILVSVWWGTDIGIIDLQQGIHNKHVQLHLFQWQLLQSTSVRNIFHCYARTEWQLKKPTLWLYLSRWSHLWQSTLHRFNPAWI